MSVHESALLRSESDRHRTLFVRAGRSVLLRNEVMPLRGYATLWLRCPFDMTFSPSQKIDRAAINPNNTKETTNITIGAAAAAAEMTEGRGRTSLGTSTVRSPSRPSPSTRERQLARFAVPVSMSAFDGLSLPSPFRRHSDA